MSEIKNGGPAFPTLLKDGEVAVAEGGMTLRDYFAAKAMQGIVAGSMASGSGIHNGDPENIARVAYLMADAMLHARDA